MVWRLGCRPGLLLEIGEAEPASKSDLLLAHNGDGHAWNPQFTLQDAKLSFEVLKLVAHLRLSSYWQIHSAAKLRTLTSDCDQVIRPLDHRQDTPPSHHAITKIQL